MSVPVIKAEETNIIYDKSVLDVTKRLILLMVEVFAKVVIASFAGSLIIQLVASSSYPTTK